MQLAGAIGESDKDGRSHSRLRQVIEAHGLVARQGQTVKVKLPHKPVHFRRADPKLPGGGNLHDYAQKLFQPLTRLSGNEDDGA